MSADDIASPTRRIGFILYDNRSGSTLLSALLDRYRSIDVSPEVGIVAQVMEARPADGRRSPRRGPGEAEPFARPGRAPDTTADRLRAVVDGLCRPEKEITYQLIKGPRLHFHLASLTEIFPDCRFVQIVRDGRAVFASKRRTKSPAGGLMDDNLLHAAWNWRRKLQLAAASGERVLTIRYEDLVRDPEATVSRVLDFLDVPAHQRRAEREIVDYYRDKIPDSHRYLHTGLREPVSAQAINAWRTELQPHEVLLYEKTSARALTDLGYELQRQGTPQPLPVRIRAQALYLAGVARWALGWISSGVRYALTPRILMQKVRSSYGEAKAARSAGRAEP